MRYGGDGDGVGDGDGDDGSLLAGAGDDSDPLLSGGDVLSVPDDRFLPDAEPPEAAADGDQLVLSFRGQMFVFDSVPMEKVQALLLMLGGKEVPSGFTSKASHSNRVSTYVSESLKTPFPESCNNSHRIASLQRFREKRKNRCFDKKVQYTVRSEVASRLKRHKGQFASSKVNSLESASDGLSFDLTERTQEKELPAFCQNCGISKDATPMMRRGPDGPKSPNMGFHGFRFRTTLLVLLLLICRSVPEEVISVDVHAAKELIDATGKHRYLDVRTVEEFRKGHPDENAINIPYMFFTPEGRIKNLKFVEEVASIFSKDEHIVVGCQSGVRSLYASADLLDSGFKHVKNMAGGYAMWVENGYLVKKHEETEVKKVEESEEKGHEERDVKKIEEIEVKKQEL